MSNTQSKGKRKPYKKKRNFSNNQKLDKKFRDNSEYMEGDRETNDPSWYARYPELMRDSASIPYSIPTGTKVSLDFFEDPSKPVFKLGNQIYTAYQSIPGIVTLGICPCIGRSIDATSPINVASDFLYSKVRAENSGRANYDSPDLILYALAMDQVYSLLTWYNRIYGVMMLYSQVNRYVPRELLRAQHIDFDDLITHINDFKAFLDTAIAQAAVFSVPSDMSLFNRHAFMYQNVYKDAESAKSQLYQFAPRVFYYYDENNGAGRLMPIDILTTYTNRMTFADLVSLFRSLMTPIISAEDFNIMSGDILKAFGEGNLVKLQLMPANYTILPITDYEVLTQIKNATCSSLGVGINYGSANWSIHQDANVDFIEYDPIIGTPTPQPGYDYVKDRFLSTYKTDPEPADNMVYTRLMFTMDEIEDTSTSPTTYYRKFDAVGSEFVTGVNVMTFSTDSNGNWVARDLAINTISESPNIIISSTAILADLIAKLTMAKHFDFMPCIYLFTTTGSGANTVFYPFFDLDNWTIVHSYELEKMHRTALMSMLRVPMIGSALPSVKTK